MKAGLGICEPPATLDVGFRLWSPLATTGMREKLKLWPYRAVEWDFDYQLRGCSSVGSSILSSLNQVLFGIFRAVGRPRDPSGDHGSPLFVSHDGKETEHKKGNEGVNSLSSSGGGSGPRSCSPVALAARWGVPMSPLGRARVSLLIHLSWPLP